MDLPVLNCLQFIHEVFANISGEMMVIAKITILHLVHESIDHQTNN